MVAHAVVAGEVVVYGQFPAVVVAHHKTRIGLWMSGDEIRYEATVVVLELAVHITPAVFWVEPFQPRATERVHGIGAPVVLVNHARLQSLHLGHNTVELQVAEHVVERAILHHQNYDVIDLAEVPAARTSQRNPARSLFGQARPEGLEPHG